MAIHISDVQQESGGKRRSSRGDNGAEQQSPDNVAQLHPEISEGAEDIMSNAATTETSTKTAAENDPYNNLMAEAVENPADFGADRSILTALPVRSPINGEFLRCHPLFRPDFHLYHSPFTQTVFLVFARFVPLLGQSMTRLHTLRLFITPQFAPFIWPVKAGIADSELSMSYARLRNTVVNDTIKQWMSCSQERGKWTTAPPIDPSIFPKDKELIWPPGDANFWLALAWRGNIISDKDHDEIQYRQGRKLPLSKR